MFRFNLILILLTISTPSFAHAGHDHSAPMAGFIHLVWIAPLIVAFAFGVQQLTKRKHFFRHKK